jgi:cytochrome c oxidase cbb3-type subunit 3
MVESSAPLPDADDNALIRGHNYDGIKEYDNPMPGWWIWIFWITVLFSPIYVLGVHTFGFLDSYQDDLAQGQDELQTIRHTYAEANPSAAVDAASLDAMVANPQMAQAGAVHFAAQCAACHGMEGQGLIGPNLTDAYWIHGNSNQAIFDIITKGVLEKGMPPWEAVYSPEERAELVAYINSILGTNPPNPKAPEGQPAAAS